MNLIKDVTYFIILHVDATVLCWVCLWLINTFECSCLHQNSLTACPDSTVGCYVDESSNSYSGQTHDWLNISEQVSLNDSYKFKILEKAYSVRSLCWPAGQGYSVRSQRFSCIKLILTVRNTVDILRWLRWPSVSILW